jgi:hypothetical protein
MKRIAVRVACALALAALCACARTSATTWGFSSWYRQGAGSLGFGQAFENQRNTCLSEMGITDPAQVAVDSPQETGFLQCMNAAGWCTQLWNCNKPGA